MSGKRRMVELYEVSFDHSFFLFDSQSDATAVAGLLCKGVKTEASANPLNPQARVTLSHIEPRMRRVFVAASEQACICAFGQKLKSARPQQLIAGSTGEVEP